MKFNIFFPLIISEILFCVSNTAQTIDPNYEVGTWQGFRDAAISYTFDDGTAKQFSVAIPMFNEYGFKLTMFTVINWSTGNWTSLQSAANQGHEIASHTLTHPHLGALTKDQQTTEVKNSRDQINSKIIGQKCLTIAYPYCETGDLSVTKQYYIAGRICSGYIERKSPTDFFNISSIVCGTQGNVKTIQDFNSKANSASNSKGWVVYLLHGIDNDGGYSPVTTEVLRGSLAYLDSNKTKFWVSSFGNVACYIKERNSISVKELSNSEGIITFSVTDTLDNEIYNYPITLRRILPDGWLSPEISQNGKAIESQIVEANSKKYIMFNVVPDEGDITFSKDNSTGFNYNETIKPLSPELFQNYPNPFNPVTTIEYEIAENSLATLNIYDVLGREVKRLVNDELSPGKYSTQFDGSNLPGGLYLCNLKAGLYSDTKKIIYLK